ncbi:uncharacterized protein LOC123219761 [Mangifera indica]|uniref:uncharacterized protein LOC123219761 n=1 Tax=Mangifera indica TaxID=29780 RepID=UPI001CF9904F|nr:uncharacterized protein LOC123219761 [Mangifera indica]
MFEAAKRGNVMFLDIIWETYPDTMFEVDGNHCSIFHVVVMYDHYSIFSFIHIIGPLKKDLIVWKSDEDQNNILRLAGMLAPTDWLSVVSGAALQLQWELLWFSEVREIMHPSHHENSERETPRALVTKEHGELKKWETNE